MSLFHQDYRQVTPENAPRYSTLLQPGSCGSDQTSHLSYHSYDNSPNSVNTHVTTPPRSPRGNGPALLPKVRAQDQGLDPIATVSMGHRKTVSLSSTGYPEGYEAQFFASQMYRRSISPADACMITPVSEAALTDFENHMTMPGATLGPKFAFPVQSQSQASHSRNTSGSSFAAHSRSSSTSVIDDMAARKYICPSYRTAPTYIRSTSETPISAPLAAIAPSYMQSQAQPKQAPAELLFDSYGEETASATLLDYLSAPNPTPGLVRKLPTHNRLQDTHFWWDVRNLRTWSDFNLQTIQSIPCLDQLLAIPLPEPAFRQPGPVNVHPQTLAALQETYAEHFVTKVNTALWMSLNSGFSMHAAKSGSSTQQPDFVASYDTDYQRTSFGDCQGRVVGLVKAYEQWNSGMRADSASARIDYLRELAHLHRVMREHSCRYGFIANEIEVVCVRAGTETGVPYFGVLELAPPVQLKTNGPGVLTAGLALWYLHMLATDQPLAGQLGWRMDVGAPAARTRANCRPRDSWMLKPEGKEKRIAKSIRGWVFPEDAFSRKEGASRGRKYAR